MLPRPGATSLHRAMQVAKKFFANGGVSMVQPKASLRRAGPRIYVACWAARRSTSCARWLRDISARKTWWSNDRTEWATLAHVQDFNTA